MVFSDHRYLALAAGVIFGLFILLSYMSQIIFFEPQLSFYVPSEETANFVLIVILSVLSGIVASLSVYRIVRFGHGIRRSGGGFLGTIIGAGAGTCSCGTIGFAAASAAGSIGGTATAILSQYEIPLRLISIAILGYTYYISVKGFSTSCRIVK